MLALDAQPRRGEPGERVPPVQRAADLRRELSQRCRDGARDRARGRARRAARSADQASAAAGNSTRGRTTPIVIGDPIACAAQQLRSASSRPSDARGRRQARSTHADARLRRRARAGAPRHDHAAGAAPPATGAAGDGSRATPATVAACSQALAVTTDTPRRRPSARGDECGVGNGSSEGNTQHSTRHAADAPTTPERPHLMACGRGTPPQQRRTEPRPASSRRRLDRDA